MAFTQLAQIRGSQLSQLSRSLAATFGTTPWRSAQQQADGDVLGLVLERLKQEWTKSVESYVKQLVNNQFMGEGAGGGGGKRNSRGQAVTDFALLTSRYLGRNS